MSRRFCADLHRSEFRPRDIQKIVLLDYADRQKPKAEVATQDSQSTGANVIVLAADPVLIDLLRDSLAGNHRVWRADDPAHAADLIVAAGNAVLLVDASLADHDAHELVTQVHQQFPDLAIIVAGRRDDETRLAGLVSQGAIFRFLHLPASADRIRNFVDATQRRHQQGADLPAAAPRPAAAAAIKLPELSLPSLKVDRAGARRWLRRSLLLIPLALAIWLIASWKPWESLENLLPGAGTEQAAPAAARQRSAVQKLLDAAGLALSQGQLIDPPERNALELYRAVLARDPGNATARRGVDRIADELLMQAEQALLAQDLARLASAVDAARSAKPDHPRLEFFTTQLARERERLARSSMPSRTAGNTRPVTDRAQGLVLLANERMRSNQLIGGNDSAHAYLMSAQRLDPADPGVQQGIAKLSALLQGNTRQAIREGRLDDAGAWLHNAVALDTDRAEVAQLRSDLEVARLGSAREDRSRLLLLANQRIAQGRLVTPVADSARHYLDLLRAADPAYNGLSDTSALLATHALAEVRRRLAAGSLTGTDELLKAAADFGAPPSEVTAVSAEMAAARAPRPATPVVLPESAMRRTQFVEPEYPTRALEQGIEGWVDIEFTVATDGTTRNATVRAAEPMGVFDRAALAALARWRYEPRMVNGSVVEQRGAARVRFQIKD